MTNRAGKDGLEARVRRHAGAGASGWMEDGTGLVVALSGGIDSMTLLYLLRFSMRIPPASLHAAHVDHRMRRGSEGDAAWVEAVCAQWGVAFHLHTAVSPVSTEAEGRDLRYRFFEGVRRGVGPGARVATAHTADDQAETVLFRAARGGGPRGLGGIRPERSPSILRPLLPFWRAEVEAFAIDRRIPFREDPSNRDLRWTRNRLRHRVLPALEQAVPGATASLVALAETSRLESAALAELLDRRIEALTEGGGGELVGCEQNEAPPKPARSAGPPPELALPRAALRALSGPVLTVLLRRSVSRFGAEPGRKGTADLVRFVQESSSGRRVILPGNVTVEHRLDHFRIRRLGEPDAASVDPSPPCVRIPAVGRSGEEGYVWGVQEVQVAWGSFPRRGFPMVARLSPEDVRFPLVVRPWRPGDRVSLPYGKKKVTKLLLEARIPGDRRPGHPVLADADGSVLWVPGLTSPPSRSSDAGLRFVEISVSRTSPQPGEG